MTENEALLKSFSIGLSLWDFILGPKAFPIRQPFKHCKNHWENPAGTPWTTSFRCLKQPSLAWNPIFTMPWKDGWGHSKTSIVQSLCHLSNYFISLATVWKTNPSATMDLSFVLYQSGLVFSLRLYLAALHITAKVYPRGHCFNQHFKISVNGKHYIKCQGFLLFCLLGVFFSFLIKQCCVSLIGLVLTSAQFLLIC